MKIALAQIQCTPGKVAANTGTLRAAVAHAAREGAEMLLFPELSDTGYDLEAIRATAGTWPGPFYNELREMAATHKLWLCGGLSEKTGEGIYNSLVVIDPGGTQRARYRKTHLFSRSGETRVFVPGNETCALRIGDLTWGFMICYDLRFPELSRKLVVERGAEVLVNVSAWPASRKHHWQTLLRARAIENQAYVLAANRTGTDAGLTFAGHSTAIDPSGTPLVEAQADEKALLVVEINPTSVQSARKDFPVLDNRRNDLY